ncbi:MAG: N-acetyl-gamma-glutamyl-phosphate reductase [Candidatus Omnitrophota bacterium]|nr:N-acetyl-gamma-glutamyl-phosphate reductase [Candidatus Omnitrophota bacterium]
MLRVGIIGATGYTGEEILKILLKHPQVRINYLAAKIERAQDISSIFPSLKGRLSLVCGNLNMEKAIANCDVLFLALPHTVSMQVVPNLLKAGKRIIDLSADYRFESVASYEACYGVKHKDKKNLTCAVYGLPELYREDIKKAKLIANPGCYPTAAILALSPIIAGFSKHIDSIIIDAKSGLTGAGRKAAMDFFFSEINENIKAYKINIHQHMPEIEQELSKLAGRKVHTTFVPHLIPMNRGILETIYIRFNTKFNLKSLKAFSLYKNFYDKEPFVRIKEEGLFPQTRDVFETNFCDIGLKVNEGNLLIVVAAIDNLMKGASGQAVQNLNIMYGFKEAQALL